MADARRRPENSLLSNKHVLREISELKREVEWQKKVLQEVEEDNKEKLDDPFFQKLAKLKEENREKENKIKLETKNFRQLESGLKKVCLVNVKLDARLETEEELTEFRRSKLTRKKNRRNGETEQRKVPQQDPRFSPNGGPQKGRFFGLFEGNFGTVEETCGEVCGRRRSKFEGKVGRAVGEAEKD